jgi:hypothetical protein
VQNIHNKGLTAKILHPNDLDKACDLGKDAEAAPLEFSL